MYTSVLKVFRCLHALFVGALFGPAGSSSSSSSSKMADEEYLTDVNHRAYTWCRECLGGAWASLREEEFRMTRLSGGLTNYLYICSLPEVCQSLKGEPHTILLRVYGHVAKTNVEFVVRNSIVFAILSEKGLGPKLYGAFPDSRLEEYIPARSLLRNDLSNPVISRCIAKKLGEFHMLEMPLCKKPKWLKEVMQKWLLEIKEFFLCPGRVKNERIRTFLPMNIDLEMNSLLEKLEKLNSPVVFSHNDLQEGNVLYLDRDCSSHDVNLVVIDWEYCAYNYRGFDMGNHFLEWCYDYAEPDSPYFMFYGDSYPSKKQQYEFFHEYLKGNNQKDVTEESLHRLYIEANNFALASHLMWGLWALVQSISSEINFGYLEYAQSRFEEYLKLKEKLPSMLAE